MDRPPQALPPHPAPTRRDGWMHDFFKGQGRGSAVDVASMLDSEAPALMGAIVQCGALLGLATTRDGGALSVTLTWDGEYRREYFRETEDLMAFLKEALPVFEELAQRDGPPATGTPIRSRKRAR